MKKIIICIVFLCLCAHISQGQRCKAGYFFWGGRYCFKVSSVRSSWKDAEASCTVDGGYLASIHSAAEMKFVRILMLIRRARTMYLGIYRDPDHDLFLNQDETEGDFFQWKNGEPPFAKTKKCVRVSTADGNRWTVGGCDEPLQYLCKTYLNRRFRVKRVKRQRCHVCYNAASNEECNSNVARTCSEYETSCQNEVRTHGGRTSISKRCKQQEACENDFQQNTRAAWMVAQCSSSYTTNSVCRCCCKGETCNEAMLPCIGDTSCPPLNASGNAFIDCNNGQNSGSICTFRCGQGYRLIGRNTRQCIGLTQQWSGESPSCESTSNIIDGFRVFFINSYITLMAYLKNKIKCPERKGGLPNGNVVCSDNRQSGSRCTYTCAQNYTLAGSNRISCLSLGRWSASVPTCRLTTCQEPRPIPNGRLISPRARQVGSVRQYTCDRGYTMSGMDSRVCLDTNNDKRGEWEGTPVCERIQCVEQIASPQNGNVRIEDTFFGSAIRYTCDRRYYLDGNSSGICVDSNNDGVGEWSISSPSCQAITCNVLSAPPFSMVDGVAPYLVDDELSVICDPGHFLVGETTLMCLDDDKKADGVWSNELPTCREIVCNTINNPTNGAASTNNSPTWNSVVSFNCSEGYFLQGEERLRCIDANNDGVGDWDSEEPICNLIRCPSLVVPPNGRLASPQQNRYGSVVRFLCDEGYYIVGFSSNLTCEDYNDDGVGDWDNSTPVCQRIVCRDILPTPRNGQILSFPDNTAFYGSTYEFACDLGYFLIGSDVISCGDVNNDNEGDWLQELPVCRQILCPELVAPSNGFFASISSLGFGDSLTVECHDGFFLIGNSSLTCDDSNTDGRGDWNVQLPMCQQITCSSNDVQDPTNGNLELPGSLVWGSRAIFVCDEGYFLDGENQRTCRDLNVDGLGEWEGTSPVCQRVLCPVLTNPGNGKYFPTEVTYGTEVTFSCNEGYFLRGQNVLECTDLQNDDAIGEWNSMPPSCEQILCPSILAPVNGGVWGLTVRNTTGQQVWGTQATFTCDPGYFLDGVSTIECVDEFNDGTGEWDNASPTCTLIECPSLRSPVSGSYVISDDVFRVGTTVAIDCDVGYYETYNDDVICMNRTNSAVGQWDGILPTCEQILCTDISQDPPNGATACSDFNIYGSLCVFQCDRGYFLRGSNITQCEDIDNNGEGEWTSEVPVCQKITCDPTLSAPENGTVDCDLGNDFSSECHFSCDNGFFLKGNDILVCQGGDRDGTGTWSQEAPICGQINCTPQQSPNNGAVSCSDGNKYGSRCIFECDLGHTAVGFDTVACGDPTADFTARWDGDPVFCEMNECETPSNNPVNGTYECTNANFYGSQCNYSCNEGYILVGTETRSCTADRRWSEDEPTCEIQRCSPMLENPADGVVFCTNEDKFGSICSYFCDLGFELLGSETTTCLADSNSNGFGEFSDTPPFCEAIYCTDIEGTVEGGSVICGIGSEVLEGNRYGSECVLICDDGYRADGDRRAICLGKGVWTKTIGTCERYRCFPPLPTPRFGSKVCTTRDDAIGTVCRFQCSLSPLVGASDQVTCLADGSWDLPPPSCSRR